jgi:general secretion pathway protein F
VTAFRYVAIDRAGQLARGVMDAPSEESVIERLRALGHTPMRAEPARAGHGLGDLLHLDLTRRGLRRSEVANLTRELSIMLTAGQDLDHALRFLVETAPNKRASVILGDIRDAVRGGSPLARALAAHPTSFSTLYIGLVRAGEAGGTLAATLERIASILERERSLAATIQSALVYPAVLTVAATGSIVLLLTQVLPQFVPLFEQAGATLPGPTQALITAGNLVSAYGLYALIALALAGLILRQALQRPGPRLFWDRLRLRLPLFGPVSREAMAARFARTLGTLVQNGMPLVGALEVVQDAMGNRAGAAAVAEATQHAKGGAGLATPLAASGLFPTRTIHLLRLGEETAQLGPMALRAAEIHEENVRMRTQRLVSLLVPAITIAMGAAIAGIVSSLMLAMLSLNDLAH